MPSVQIAGSRIPCVRGAVTANLQAAGYSPPRAAAAEVPVPHVPEELVALTVEVSCINKSDSFEPHERIRYVGGFDANGTRWKLSHEAAIEGTEAGTWHFYVGGQGHESAWVIVAISPSGQKYLKTDIDDDQPTHLLSLPECPRMT